MSEGTGCGSLGAVSEGTGCASLGAVVSEGTGCASLGGVSHWVCLIRDSAPGMLH